MEKYFNNLGLLNLIFKWKIPLAIIMVLAIGLSVLFSSSIFIKPKYKSTAVIYPSNLIPYSDETPTEQMLQILHSDDIRDSLIKKFDLTSHYEIDKNQKFYFTNLIKEYEKNVSITKTEFESVQIDIMDTDPIFACNMVKSMVNYFNLKTRTLQRDKAKEVLLITEIQLEDKEKQIDSIKKKMDDIRVKYEILDYKVQTKELYKNYYKGNSNFQTVNNEMNNLKAKGGEFQILNEQLQGEIDAYGKLKVDYETALRDVNKELTYSNNITSPVPADKKSYPIRWLIVLASTVATMILSFIVIYCIENLKTKINLTKED
jgi:hypothetical protein